MLPKIETDYTSQNFKPFAILFNILTMLTNLFKSFTLRFLKVTWLEFPVAILRWRKYSTSKIDQKVLRVWSCCYCFACVPLVCITSDNNTLTRAHNIRTPSCYEVHVTATHNFNYCVDTCDEKGMVISIQAVFQVIYVREI